VLLRNKRVAAEDDHRRRAHLARDLFTLGHLPIVIGAALLAVAIEKAQPARPLDRFGATALTAGPAVRAVFLAGFVAGNLRATGQVLATRAVGAAVVVLTGATLSTRIDAVAAIAVTAALIAAIGGIESRSHSRAAAHDDEEGLLWTSQ